MRLNTTSSVFAILILVFVAGGCIFNTNSTTVKGIVIYDDKPVSGAEVWFGPTGGQVTTTTGPDGKFTLTAKHRMTGMLRLTVKKAGMGQKDKVEFPGFAAPDEEIKVEMLTTFAPTRR
jgi:hypothetical protein